MTYRRRGYSFLELLVVMIMISALVALLLPAVQAAREAARRRNCQSQLSQLILAVHNYEMLHGVYPPGTIESQGPIRNWPSGYHASWIVQILPLIEYEPAQRQIDFRVGVYDPQNAAVRRLDLRLLQCPSGDQVPGRNSYAAVHHDREAPIDRDNDGVFFLNSRVRHEQVSDGLSHTIFLGEIVSSRDDLGWMSGTRATLRNTDWSAAAAGTAPVFPLGPDGLPVLDERTRQRLLLPADPAAIGNAAGGEAAGGNVAGGNGAGGEATGSNGTPAANSRPADSGRAGGGRASKALLFVGGFSSPHPGGAQFAMGDGSVRFLSSTVDPPLYQRLGNRHDGHPDDDAF